MFILIDNYDSFTYNLVQYLGDLGVQVSIYRNDQVKSSEVIKKKPRAIVLSPGPCDPDKAGICLDLVNEASEQNIPVLGVCLGHQAIGQAFGGKIVRAKEPVHGKVSTIQHNGKNIFSNLPSPMNATRYHSLIIDRPSFPETLEITAESDDKTIMGLMHKEKPIHGIQFHPESIASDHGHALLKNFISLTEA